LIISITWVLLLLLLLLLLSTKHNRLPKFVSVGAWTGSLCTSRAAETDFCDFCSLCVWWLILGGFDWVLMYYVFSNSSYFKIVLEMDFVFLSLGFSSGLDFQEPFCKFGSAVTFRGSYERIGCFLCAWKCHLGAIFFFFFLVFLSNYSFFFLHG
jgi:hypothetical protein